MPPRVWACLLSCMCAIGCVNSPSNSVGVAGAVRSAARLVVVLFVVVRAHVKDGAQTACRHKLIYAHFWCIF